MKIASTVRINICQRLISIMNHLIDRVGFLTAPTVIYIDDEIDKSMKEKKFPPRSVISGKKTFAWPSILNNGMILSAMDFIKFL
jgi:hypothetical protein